MQRHGLINAQLAAAVARLRHTDLVVLADSGLPVPPGPEVVDLAVVYGLPRFADVLAPLLDSVVFEAATAAAEVEQRNPECWALLTESLGRVDTIPHEQLKEEVRGAVVVIRTGEATPYANVVLRCGVPFG